MVTQVLAFRLGPLRVHHRQTFLSLRERIPKSLRVVSMHCRWQVTQTAPPLSLKQNPHSNRTWKRSLVSCSRQSKPRPIFKIRRLCTFAASQELAKLPVCAGVATWSRKATNIPIFLFVTSTPPLSCRTRIQRASFSVR